MLCRIYGSDVELCNDLMTNITVYIYIYIYHNNTSRYKDIL